MAGAPGRRYAAEQNVLLRGVNDNAQTLANLSNALFDAGVMPYYLHVLDKVQGARILW